VPARTVATPPEVAPGLPSPGERRQGLDACSLLFCYLGLLMILPARLVVSGTGFDLTPALLVAFGLGMWWWCAQLVSSQGVAKGHNMVRTGIFFFMVANVASYAYGTYHYQTHDALRSMDRSTMIIIAVALVGIFVVDSMYTSDRLDRLLVYLVNLGAIVAIFGLLQFFVNVNIPGLFGKLPGLRETSTLTLVLDRADFRRPAASATHPIEFGVIMACLLPLAAHYAFKVTEAAASGRRVHGDARPKWRWACVALLAVGAFVSVSRSAILGLIAGGMVLIPTWPVKRRIRTVITVVVFTGLMRLMVPGLIGTLLSLFRNFGNDDSVAGRTDDYAAVGPLIKDNLWLGIGYGTYHGGTNGPLDNQYLGSLVETGLIGVLCLLIMLFAGVVAAQRVRRVSTNPWTRDLAQSLAAAVVILIVGYATFDAFAFAIITGLTFLLVGACGALLRTAQPDTWRPPP